jgi:uncharacterized protein DUF4440
LDLSDSVRDEVVAMQRRRADAMVRQDLAELGRLLADELSYTHSDGRQDTKKSLLGLISGANHRYLGVEYSNQQAISCGDAVIVRGTARMHMLKDPGGRQDYDVIFLDVWTRRDGQWQTVAWQATRA